jgi:hypothetical protein
MPGVLAAEEQQEVVVKPAAVEVMQKGRFLSVQVHLMLLLLVVRVGEHLLVFLQQAVHLVAVVPAVAVHLVQTMVRQVEVILVSLFLLYPKEMQD